MWNSEEFIWPTGLGAKTNIIDGTGFNIITGGPAVGIPGPIFTFSNSGISLSKIEVVPKMTELDSINIAIEKEIIYGGDFTKYLDKKGISREPEPIKH